MPLLGPFAFVVLVLMIFTISYYVRAHRESCSSAVVRHLEIIVGQNLPIPIALQLAAQTERGATRRVLRRCGQLTQLGLGLSDALRRAYPKCPSTLLSAIIVAERTNTLPATLQEWAPRLERRLSRRQFAFTARFSYSLATWCIFLLILAAVSYFIWPKFLTIAGDFHVPIHQTAIDVLQNPFAFEMPRTWMGVILKAAIFSSAGFTYLIWRWIRFRLFRRRATELSAIDRTSDWLSWFVSPFQSYTRAHAWSQALPSIRLAVAAGNPLVNAVHQATQLDVNAELRRGLAEWSEAMRIGESPVVAAKATNVPDLLVRWLAMGERDGSFDAALLHAERYYSALAERRGNLILHILWPAVVFTLAFLTGTVLYTIVTILVSIINTTMSYIE